MSSARAGRGVLAFGEREVVTGCFALGTGVRTFEAGRWTAFSESLSEESLFSESSAAAGTTFALEAGALAAFALVAGVAPFFGKVGVF